MTKAVFAGLALAGALALADADAHMGVLQAAMGAYPGCTGDGCLTGGSVKATFGEDMNIPYEYTLEGVRPSLKAAKFAVLAAYEAANKTAFGAGIEAEGNKGVFVEHNADGTIEFHYDLTMNENSTTGGIHIHKGKSCDDPGPHYWDSKNNTVTDTWGADTKWASGADGKAKGSFKVAEVYGFGDNTGRVVVVHDASGAKMACAVLGVASAGWHVHVGTTCDVAAEVGGHYWDSKNDTVADPWTVVKFNAEAATVSGNVASVNDGYGRAAHVGHAVVVHSATGAKIGCGVLKATAVAPKVTAPANVTTVAAATTVTVNAKDAAEAATKAYTDAGCDKDATKTGCADLKKKKDAADAAAGGIATTVAVTTAPSSASQLASGAAIAAAAVVAALC